jgi:hypothetical protein
MAIFSCRIAIVSTFRIWNSQAARSVGGAQAVYPVGKLACIGWRETVLSWSLRRNRVVRDGDDSEWMGV